MATTMPQKLLWLQGLRLSTKLTIAYTVIVMLVAGILAWVLYVQLREAQRVIAQEHVQDMVNLAVTQIDADFHTLIVVPDDMTSSFYRIIQSELQNIQAASISVTRIRTLRERSDGTIVVVVDQPRKTEAAAPIGQPIDIRPPLLAAGLGIIDHTMVEKDPITLPSGAVRLYGYAPIMDPSGRQDGVLMIELDAAPLRAGESQARATALMTFFLTLPLVLLVGIWLVRRLTAPVGDLLLGTERITQGDLAHRVRVQSRDELGILAATFNTMAESLQARIMAEQQARQDLDRAHQHLQAYSHSLEQALQEQTRLSDTIRRMSLPVLPIADQIIVLPLIGTIDEQRADDLFTGLLQGIAQHRARVALLDLTGVALVDDTVARVLSQAITAARLLGAIPLLVGIRPNLAQAFVQIGADLSHITTSATLQSGLLHALALTGRRLVMKGSRHAAEGET